jgi:hypothetical protein
MFKKSTFSLAFVLSGFVVVPSWGQWNLSNGVAQIHSSVVNVQLFQKDMNLNGNTNHGLGYYGGNTKLWENKKIDGPVLYGASGGALGSYRKADGADAQKTALTWDRVGNVVVMKDLKVSSNLSVKKIVVDSSITILDKGKKIGYKFLSIGDDAYLSDVDRSNTIALMGSTAEEKNPATLQLGTNTKNRIFGRSDGKIGVSTHMEVAGSVKASKIIFPDGTSFVSAWQTPGSEFLWVSDSVKDATTNVVKKYIRYAGNQQITGTLKLGNSSLYLKGYKDATENTNEMYADNGPLLINSNSSQTDANTPNTIINANGGKVGIGTATLSSNAKLDVAGNVNATGYLVNGSPLLTSQWTTKAEDNSISFGNGSVGIGTSLPITKLHIEDNSNGWMQTIKGTATKVNDFIGLKFKAGYPREETSLSSWDSKWAGIALVSESEHGNSNGLALYSAQTERLRIDKDGNVGIGTTSPQAKLQIDVSSQLPKVGIMVNGNNATYGLADIVIARTNTNGNVGSGATLQFNDEQSGNNSSSIIQHSSSGLQYFNSNNNRRDWTERLRIDNDGNVGIGSFSLDSKLNIGASPNNSAFRIDLGSGNNIDKYFFDITPYILVPGIVGYTFSTRSQQNTQTNLLNFYNGSVGIGTNNPRATLEVNGSAIINGKIQTTEVSVCLNPGSCPDYVFEKDYCLQSLKEVEQYISQNKHLPEIPSAKEMESNGMNMKELNLSLLKKVEELTLHLIEQNKKFEEQQKKIEALESKIK